MDKQIRSKMMAGIKGFNTRPELYLRGELHKRGFRFRIHYGYSEPDYLGWEIKSHNVKKFSNPASGQPITLMTPEPTAGFYRESGVERFTRRFGYPDKRGRADRINFGGPYKCGVKYLPSGLTLIVEV